MTPSLLAGLGWLFTALLLVLVLVGVAAGRGAIPRNHLVGVRLPPLLRNDVAWRAGHRAAVLPAGCAFAVALIGSAASFALPAASWIAIAAFATGVVWVLIRSSRAATATAVDHAR